LGQPEGLSTLSLTRLHILLPSLLVILALTAFLSMLRHGHGPRAELELLLLLLLAAAGQGQGRAWPWLAEARPPAGSCCHRPLSSRVPGHVLGHVVLCFPKKKKAGTSCWNMKQLRVPYAKTRLI